jgi:hypothetical protein
MLMAVPGRGGALVLAARRFGGRHGRKQPAKASLTRAEAPLLVRAPQMLAGEGLRLLEEAPHPHECVADRRRRLNHLARGAAPRGEREGGLCGQELLMDNRISIP